MVRLYCLTKRLCNVLPWCPLKYHPVDYETNLESTLAGLSLGGSTDNLLRPADLYHTSYNLAGFSTAQHRVYRSLITEKKLEDAWQSSDGPITGGVEELRKVTWARACAWQEDEGAHFYLGGEQNRVVSRMNALEFMM
jgi:hypothetical protein